MTVEMPYQPVKSVFWLKTEIEPVTADDIYPSPEVLEKLQAAQGDVAPRGPAGLVRFSDAYDRKDWQGMAEESARKGISPKRNKINYDRLANTKD